MAAASAAGGFGCVEIAIAAPMVPPVVDKVSVRVLVDSAYNLFLRPGQVKDVKVEPAPRPSDYRRALLNQWGLSLYIESQRASEQHTVMVDFGYTPEALNNNVDYVGADPKKIEALIVSHGHFDHYGGLIGTARCCRRTSRSMPAARTISACATRDRPASLPNLARSIGARLRRATLRPCCARHPW